MPLEPFLYRSADALCARAMIKIFTANRIASARISRFRSLLIIITLTNRFFPSL